MLGIHDILGTDPAPDPRIHTSDYRIRLRILLFFSVIFKMAKKLFL
jgi:hypothetical protein